MQLHTLLEEAFSGSSLFAGLDPQRITQLQPPTGSLREGEVLFQQGDPAEVSYVLIRGVLGLHTGPLSTSTPFFRKVVSGELVGSTDRSAANRAPPRPWPSPRWTTCS